MDKLAIGASASITGAFGQPSAISARAFRAPFYFPVFIGVKPNMADKKDKAFTPLALTLPALAAGTDFTGELGVVPEAEAQGGWSLAKLSITSPTLVTGVTATAVTLVVSYSRAGAARVTIGTLVLITGVNLPADTEVAIPISAAPALLPGDVIAVATTHASTGIALPVGAVVRAEVQ